MQKIHDFRERLDYSTAASAEAFWRAVYLKAFPDMLWMQQVEADNEAQKRGVDRYIGLPNDSIIRIDEKKREKEYPDILLEYLSNDRTGAPGWIEKQLAIDYLAYAFMPTRRVYLFPWLLLRRAWLHYGEDWKRKYQNVSARNSMYNTISVCVPVEVVLKAVRTASIIEV